MLPAALPASPPRASTRASRRRLLLWGAMAGLPLGLPFAVEALQPLAFVAAVPFLLMLTLVPLGRGLLFAWFAGTTFIGLGCYWLASLSPLFVAICAAHYGVYFLPYALVPVVLRRWPRLPLWTFVPTLGTFMETSREIFCAFETTWWALGYTQVRTPLAQVAEWTGVAGVTFLVLLTNAVCADVALCLVRRSRATPSSAARTRPPLWSIACGAASCAGLVAIALVVGSARKRHVEEAIRPGPEVLLVQGNISVEDKNRSSYAPFVFDRQVRLTRAGLTPAVRLVAWAETMPIHPEVDKGAKVARDTARSLGRPLLLGGFGVVDDEGVKRRANSAFLLSERGQVLGRYDKQALVAFGEYVPFFGAIRPLRRALGSLLADAYTGFDPFLQPGSDDHLFSIAHGGGTLRFAAPICYEDVLPSMTRRFANKGADFFVLISNENYFGLRELDQHVDMAVFRAIETRRPVLRATNTGRTCVIDPAGRITRRLERNTEASLRAAVPLYGAPENAPFMQAAFGWLCGLPAAGVVAWALRQRG